MRSAGSTFHKCLASELTFLVTDCRSAGSKAAEVEDFLTDALVFLHASLMTGLKYKAWHPNQLRKVEVASKLNGQKHRGKDSDHDMKPPMLSLT